MNDKRISLDEQLNLVLHLASRDKDIYFVKEDWLKKINKVKKQFGILGGDFGVGVCPKCKQKYVLEKSDGSARQCLNHNCDYSYSLKEKRESKPKKTNAKRVPPSIGAIATEPSHNTQYGLGNLHEKGKYSK